MVFWGLVVNKYFIIIMVIICVIFNFFKLVKIIVLDVILFESLFYVMIELEKVMLFIKIVRNSVIKVNIFVFSMVWLFMFESVV